MSPVVGVEDHVQPGIHSLIPVEKGINLSRLLEYLLQKTYHDLTILSELLPRKSDIERKIEIIQFATKARQQFIRVLALVKWAASAERVDKCQAKSNLLDQQNAYFIDAADSLVRVAREYLVQARLPNFSIPTAVDVLTTGTFKRLPRCIKTKIIPDDPISQDDKSKTFKRLNEVMQKRLVSSKIPSEFTKLKISNGKIIMTVENEFEVTLMLMGDGNDLPWRLLNIEFLMEDFETGDGKSLVHGMQIHYIHQISQSRLLVQEDPLCDLYKTLHFFCLSLQLEVFYTQSKRLIAQRWGDFVKIEEYIPGQKLIISYCRASLMNAQSQKAVYPTISVMSPEEDQTNLVLHHSPKLNFYTSTENKHFENLIRIEEISKDNVSSKTYVNENENGIQLSTSCLSIEKVFTIISSKYSLFRLSEIYKQFQNDPYLINHIKLDEIKPSLDIKPYEGCSNHDLISISVVQKTGRFKVEHDLLSLTQKTNLEKLVNTDIKIFIESIHRIRTILYLEKCRQCLSLFNLAITTQLPIVNIDSYKANLPTTKLYLQFKSNMNYCMVLTIELDTKKNLVSKIYLLKLKVISEDFNKNDNTTDNQVKPVKSVVTYEVKSLLQLNSNMIHYTLLQSHAKRSKQKRKRKSVFDREKDISKRLKNPENHLSTSETNTSSNETSQFKDPLHEIKSMVSSTISRLPFIELSQQCLSKDIIFTEHGNSNKFTLQVLQFPKFFNQYSLKDILLACNITLDTQSNMWRVVYKYDKPILKRCTNISHDIIEIRYTLENIVDELINDWEGFCKIYENAVAVEDILKELENQDVCEFRFQEYDVKSLTLNYGSDQDYKLILSYSGKDKQFIIDIGETGVTRQKSPHHVIRVNLTNEFNHHQNLQYILKIVHHTFIPLKSISKIPILPGINGINANIMLSVVNNFTVIVNSSTHLKLVYRNNYMLDIYLMESSVLVRDGTLYRTDSTKAMRGFSTVSQLNQFLQLFTDKTQSGYSGYDYAYTPGGAEFDHQNEHYGPASHDSSTSTKDRSMKSPAVVISSPPPFNQFTAPSPGNTNSVPSPGTFIQPSPVSMNISAMSPNAWPGSPPIVQGSPRTAKQLSSSNPQYRQVLSSINVSHSPVPVLLSHNEFQKMFVLKEYENVHLKKAPKLCSLERFFGSVMLRTSLLRVLRQDETLKLEKNEHGVVIFSGTGKNGVETGLQYTVRLNQTMDSLVLKASPMKGHESNWQNDDLKVLEQFFECKVVCAPYKVCALTAFARILGAQPKIIKDFIRIMKLELQTDWSNYLFKVEWCLIKPPEDIHSIGLPGTPGVLLRNNKNLIFLQLTEVKNSQNTVTVSIVHDLATNKVQYFPPNNAQDQNTWAGKARNQFQVTLQKISDTVAKKDQPIFCAVFTVLKKMQVR